MVLIIFLLSMLYLGCKWILWAIKTIKILTNNDHNITNVSPLRKNPISHHISIVYTNGLHFFNCIE